MKIVASLAQKQHIICPSNYNSLTNKCKYSINLERKRMSKFKTFHYQNYKNKINTGKWMSVLRQRVEKTNLIPPPSQFKSCRFQKYNLQNSICCKNIHKCHWSLIWNYYAFINNVYFSLLARYNLYLTKWLDKNI